MMNSGQQIRVLLTADTMGGVWGYSLELAAAAAEHGYEFVILTMGRPPSVAQRRSAEALPNVRLMCAEYKLESMEDPWNDVDAAAQWILSICREVQPDLVHLNHYSFATLPFEVPILVTAHTCVCNWWQAVRRCSPPPRYDEYRTRVAAGLAAADMVVAPTCSMLEDLGLHYGPLPDSRVVHNGRSALWGRSERGQGGLTPRPKDPVILAAGRLWDEAKNVAQLDAVAGRLNWPCLIAGELHHPDGGKATAHHCVALGQLGEVDMAAQFSRTAIFAHPARYEPFGLAPLEAALAGCALVLGDIPSLRELWDGAASFVDPDDPEMLHLALDELMNRPARRALAAAAAWQRAAIYSPERLGAGYAAIYSDLCEKAREQRAQMAGARQH